MKKFLILLSVSLSLVLSFTYCAKVSKEDIVEPITNQEITSSDKRLLIYWASWDGWGRTSNNCNGFGLCHYQDCWFCCMDEFDRIVDCRGGDLRNAGTIYIPENGVEGIMIIKLNPEYSEQQEAIDHNKDLHVDQDLESELFIVRAGNYPFNPEIGSFGGYELNVSKNSIIMISKPNQ